MTDKTLVHYDVERGVAVLTLDSPPANTYTHEMMVQLDQAIIRARFDDGVQVIVVTGAGEKFFCAGADIRMLSEVTAGFKYCFCLHANETLNRFEQTPKPVIGALNGHAVGGGLEIALACDIRLARKDGGQCGLPEVALGVLPGTGGTERLVRLVGKAKAIELMASGEVFDFNRGLELGLINRIVEAESSSAFKLKVMEYARQFTTPNAAVKAVGNIKRSVQTAPSCPSSWPCRSSASSSSSCSRARMPRRAFPPTWRDGKPRSRAPEVQRLMADSGSPGLGWSRRRRARAPIDGRPRRGDPQTARVPTNKVLRSPIPLRCYGGLRR